MFSGVNLNLKNHLFIYYLSAIINKERKNKEEEINAIKLALGPSKSFLNFLERTTDMPFVATDSAVIQYRQLVLTVQEMKRLYPPANTQQVSQANQSVIVIQKSELYVQVIKQFYTGKLISLKSERCFWSVSFLCWLFNIKF